MTGEGARVSKKRGSRIVLVVDDEEDVRVIAAEVLRSAGFEVVMAASGRDAIQMVEEQAIDVLFTDVVMPGMSGYQLARELRSIRPGLPVLYTSGSADMAAGRQVGEDAFLLKKPWRLRELVDQVARCCEEAHG